MPPYEAWHRVADPLYNTDGVPPQLSKGQRAFVEEGFVSRALGATNFIARLICTMVSTTVPPVPLARRLSVPLHSRGGCPSRSPLEAALSETLTYCVSLPSLQFDEEIPNTLRPEPLPETEEGKREFWLKKEVENDSPSSYMVPDTCVTCALPRTSCFVLLVQMSTFLQLEQKRRRPSSFWFAPAVFPLGGEPCTAHRSSLPAPLFSLLH